MPYYCTMYQITVEKRKGTDRPPFQRNGIQAPLVRVGNESLLTLLYQPLSGGGRISPEEYRRQRWTSARLLLDRWNRQTE